LTERSEPILLPYQRRWLKDHSPMKIWLAARQVGKSFTLALEAVLEALRHPSDNLLLAASERQSRECMQKVCTHLRYLRVRSQGFLKARESTHEVRLPNGSRIICLPASPDTVRGFSGNIFLDEFAFHRDAHQIWRAMYPSTTRGYKVRLSSSPNGKANLFYTLWSQAGGFSRHRTTIHDAVREGLSVNIEKLRKGILEPEAWAQEYECAFLEDAWAFIGPEMLGQCLSEEASREPPLGLQGPLYLGMDVGRSHDLTVLWLWQQAGQRYITRGVWSLRNRPFWQQRELLYALLEGSLGIPVQTAALDATGLGVQLAEEAAQRFGPQRVLQVRFSLSVKEVLALTLRGLLQQGLLAIPRDRAIQEDFLGIRHSQGPTGLAHYGVAPGETHGDYFWAAALGLHAAKRHAQVSFEHQALGPRAFQELENFL